jgi:integrase/recombinase XerD
MNELDRRQAVVLPVATSDQASPWRTEALARLPEGPVDADPFWRLAAAFLVAYPDSTAKAYLGDLKAWASECESVGVHPFAARRHHVDAWVKALARDLRPATGRPASAATIARRLSCLSRFYDYGMREVELIEHSPVANVRRPKVTDDSPTIGLDAGELDRLLTAAEADGTTSAALVSLLVYNGLVTTSTATRRTRWPASCVGVTGRRRERDTSGATPRPWALTIYHPAGGSEPTA